MYNFYNLMSCPACENELSLAPFVVNEDNMIQEGILHCQSCNKKYIIFDFIPRMVPISIYRNKPFEKKYGISESELLNSYDSDNLKNIQEKTDFYFGKEWELFSRYGWDDNNFNYSDSVKAFWEKTLLDRTDLIDKLVLDAGCGNGRFSRIAIESGAKLVAVDIGRNVDAARNNLREINPNIFVVQGDILRLPFKKEIFDTIFTIGVIQHTGAPEKAFNSMVRVLKESGVISIRAYQKGNPVLEENDLKIRQITTQFTFEELIEFSKIINTLGQFLIKKQLFSEAKKYINIFNDEHQNFDWYAAPVADKLTYQQVKNWFKAKGIECIKDIDKGIPEEKRSFSAISILGKKLCMRDELIQPSRV